MFDIESQKGEEHVTITLQAVGVRLIAQDAQKYIQLLNQASGATRGMTPAADEAGRALGGLSVKSLAVGVALGNLGSQIVNRVTTGLVNLGREGLAAVSTYEQLKLSAEALTAKELRAADSTLSMADALAQAGPRAEELMAWIERLAIASPFSSEDVSAAFQQAQVYGFAANEAQMLTTAILNFAAATGKSGAVMNQVAYALGQIRNNGKVLTLDLRQLSGAGIDVTGVLAAMGKSWADVTAGTVESAAFLETFVQVLNEDFAGAGARAQNTLQGLIASLGDLKTIGLRNLLAPSVTAFEEAFSPLIGTIQNGLLPVVKMAGEYLGSFTRAVIENRNMILAAVAPIAGLVIGFVAVPAAVSLATTAVAGLGAALTFLLSPIGLVAAAVGVVGLAVGGLAGLFISSFQEIDSKTKSYFGGLTDDLFSFGENIILSLANGMAAAIGVVVGVLTQIGAMIANWLAPGSPPRLLPDIDEWGTGAMNEYLRGFLDADFGIFNQLSSTIEGYMRSLSTGDNENLIPGILGVRGAIAAAIDQMRQTGAVGEDALQGIFNTLGAVNPDLQEYIRLMFQSAQASEALKQAQEALNAITERYSNLLSPLRDELNAISDEQQRTARQDRRAELQAILETARAQGNTEAERRALMEMRALDLQDQISLLETQEAAETSAAQEAVNAAAEQAQAAAEQLAAQRALIDAQTENNRLIAQQIELLERLAEAGAGAAGGGAAAGGGIPTIPGGGLDFGLPDMDDGPFSEALHAFQKRFNDFVTELRKPFEELQDNLDKMSEAWGGAFTEMGNIGITFFEGMQGRTTESKSQLQQWSNEAGLAVYNFVAGLEGEHLKATNSFQQFANDAGLSVNSFIQGLQGSKVEGVGAFAEFTNELGYWTGRMVEDFDGTTLILLEKATVRFEALKTQVVEALNTMASTAGSTILNFVNEANLNFLNLQTQIGTIALQILAKATEAFESLQTQLGLIVLQLVNKAVENFNNLLTQIGEIALKLVVNAVGSFESLQTQIGLIVLNLVADALTNFDSLMNQLSEILGQLVISAATKMGEWVSAILTAVFNAGVWLGEKVAEFYNLGSSLIGGMAQGVMDGIQGLITAVVQGVQDALNAAADIIQPGSPSRNPYIRGLGQSYIQGIGAGIIEAMPQVKRVVSAELGGLLTAAQAINLPASSAQVAGQTITNNYYNSPTGIQNANINNGMDVAAVEAIALRVISHAIAYS